MNRSFGSGVIVRLALVLGLVLVFQRSYASVDEKAAAFILCKNKKDVRTIRILSEGEKAENCKITYSKGGVEETVGVNRTMGSCKSILKSIQTNLESSSWSCRSVQAAHVTTGEQAVTQ
jgi:hypothetical protein